MQGLLLRWLKQNKPSMEYVDHVVKKGNEMLRKVDDSLSIGPSHFMTDDLTKEWFEIIWKYSIVPDVEEAFDDPDMLNEFLALPKTFYQAYAAHEE